MAKGRGRLSFWDTLPEWAAEASMWAFDQLKEKKLTQIEILDGVNERLRAAAWQEGVTANVPQATRSSLNRQSMRLAVHSRRLQETAEIAKVLAPKFEDAASNDLTLLVAETIKTLVFEMLGNARDLSADSETAQMLMLTSRALKHAEESKKISTGERRAMEKEIEQKAGRAIEKAVKARGGSSEEIEALKQAIGVQIRSRG